MLIPFPSLYVVFAQHSWIMNLSMIFDFFLSFDLHVQSDHQQLLLILFIFLIPMASILLFHFYQNHGHYYYQLLLPLNYFPNWSA